MTVTVLWVSAGRGPEECRTAALRVADLVAAEAHEAGYSVSGPEGNGYGSSYAVVIGGDDHGPFVRSWQGSVQWTARNPRRGKASRKNWFVGITVAETSPAALAVPDNEIRYETMRAGGPGGQHQNVTDSAVRAVHVPTGTVAVSRGHRSQSRNRKAAYESLVRALSIRRDEEAAMGQRRAWRDRLAVERGNPVRIYVDGVASCPDARRRETETATHHESKKGPPG